MNDFTGSVLIRNSTAEYNNLVVNESIIPKYRRYMENLILQIV